jgi:hypothetical protein
MALQGIGMGITIENLPFSVRRPMSEIRTTEGVLLRPIPVSPSPDYMAGEDGRIYSRTKYKGFGRKELTDWYPLVGHRSTKGYLNVSLSHENRKVTRSVHRLVCMAFHGMPASQTMQVRHLDGSPENNRPSNLAWGSQYENWEDRRAHGRVALGEAHHAAKLTDAEREHLRWALEKGLCSAKHAARMLGMSQSAISEIAAKETASG